MTNISTFAGCGWRLGSWGGSPRPSFRPWALAHLFGDSVALGQDRLAFGDGDFHAVYIVHQIGVSTSQSVKFAVTSASVTIFM